MTSTTAYTPLESLLLYRQIWKLGWAPSSFAQISDFLKTHPYITTDTRYDGGRLTSEKLQELFLHDLWEELKADGNTTARNSESVSPTLKKRKLQPPPVPALSDVRNHLEKILAIRNKAEDRYFATAVATIRAQEDDILRLLDAGAAPVGETENQKSAGIAGDGDLNSAQNGGLESKPSRGAKLANGSRSPTLPASSIRHQEARNGTTVSTQASTDKPNTPVPPPVIAQQHADRQPSLAQGASRPASARPPTQETLKPSNGGSLVLQAPQGAPSLVARHSPAPPGSSTATDGLQRPEAAARPKPPPASQLAHPPAPDQGQGQWKWEPPYQPTNSRQQPTQSPQPPQRPLQPLQSQASSLQPRPPVTNVQPPNPPSLQPQQPTTPSGPQMPQPVLAPPANTSQNVSLQGTPARLPPTEHVAAPVQEKTAAAPASTPARPSPQPAQTYAQPTTMRPLAAASPIPPPPASVSSMSTPAPPQGALSRPPGAPPVPTQPQVRTQGANLQAPAPYAPAGQGSRSPAPTPALIDGQKGYNSPYSRAPRAVIPPHVQHATPGSFTPTPTRVAPAISAPQTPLASFIPTPVAGSGTKWKSAKTPSTPQQNAGGDPPRPEFEPLSPPLQPVTLPVPSSQSSSKKGGQKRVAEVESPNPKRRGRPPRSAQKVPEANLPASSTAVQLSTPVSKLGGSPMEGVSQPASEPDLAKVKDEVTTPQPAPTETGDTTADESVTSRRQGPRLNKRKWRESSPTPAATTPNVQNVTGPILSAPPTPIQPSPPRLEVVWTRSFNKVSSTAIEQIVTHRLANIFAHPIRERDAPGYNKVILRPQDLKSIRAAIMHGNRAAAQMASALPGGDPGTSTVRLPVSEELVPPKGIINSEQLDCELAHMFANAIMYNPDPDHGPGPAFLRDEDTSENDGGEGGGPDNSMLGYKVDEFSVVKDTRAMFSEVEKLVYELRSTEMKHGAQPTTAPATGTSTRHASVAGGQRDASEARSTTGVDDVDEQTATETETTGNTVKRRRTARG